MTKVSNYNAAALEDAVRSAAVDAHNRKVAEEVVRVARPRARKKTGAGAASFHVEAVRDTETGRTHYRAGPDAEHAYMGIHEVGTEKITPQPALRSAAREVQNR